MIYLILIIIILLILLNILNKLTEEKNQTQEKVTEKVVEGYPYESKKLMSIDELKYFKQLQEAYPNHIILTKVNIKDFVKVKKEFNKDISHFNRIRAKHVDFLVCDNDLKIIKIIELDGKSHNSAKAKANDQFKNKLFKELILDFSRVRSS